MQVKEEQIKEFKEIGSVLFQKKTRVKNLTLKLKPGKPITVTVPWKTSYKTAEEFILSKINWIQKHLPKIKTHERKRSQIFDEFSSIQTKFHEIQILRGEKFTPLSLLDKVNKNKILIIEVPNIIPIDHPSVQEYIKNQIEKTLHKESLEYLTPRLKEFSIHNSLPFNKLSIRKTTSRWGSCSSMNDISLSIYLMKLPDKLIDYVLLHELCHTIHHNHGKYFWNLMSKVCPEYQVARKELKKFFCGI